MAKKNEIYKCEKSGLMVEVLQDAEGTPMCCGEPMKLLRRWLSCHGGLCGAPYDGCSLYPVDRARNPDGCASSQPYPAG